LGHLFDIFDGHYNNELAFIEPIGKQGHEPNYEVIETAEFKTQGG